MAGAHTPVLCLRPCSPEVLGNQKFTEKTDMNSFGIVMWEIFSGKGPHDGLMQIQAALGMLNHDLRSDSLPSNCFRVVHARCQLKERPLT
jgi:serine/threonine protein kinase